MTRYTNAKHHGTLDCICADSLWWLQNKQDVPKPKLSNENLIINELIREYFEYNGYRHALSVFLPGANDT